MWNVQELIDGVRLRTTFRHNTFKQSTGLLNWRRLTAEANLLCMTVDGAAVNERKPLIQVFPSPVRCAARRARFEFA